MLFLGSISLRNKNPLHTEFPGLKKKSSACYKNLDFLERTIVFSCIGTQAGSNSGPGSGGSLSPSANFLQPNDSTLPHWSLLISGCRQEAWHPEELHYALSFEAGVELFTLKAYAKAPEKLSWTHDFSISWISGRF